jgi:hypothetical protein
MKNRSLLFLLTLTLLCTPFLAQSKVVDKIEHYGVYVVAKKGYVKLGHYNHPGQFVDFKYLSELPTVIRADDNLKLIVFQKDFTEEKLVMALRPIQTTVEVKEIRFNVKPLKKEDMYELTLDRPVSSGTILHANSGYFWKTYMGSIVLGDTQKELEKYFSRKDLGDAYAVKAYLDDALKAYPKNSKLKKLGQYWNKEAKKEKAARTYGYVEAQWKKYQETPKIKLKVRYLRGMIGEINAYLRDHSNAENAKEAKDRKLYAEKKIEEIEKQL